MATIPLTRRGAAKLREELNRLKNVTDRFLRLAKSEQPDFLYPVETAIGDLVSGTVTRWMATHPSVTLGVVEDAVMSVDPDRVAEALDELIGNAVVHCPAGTSVEVSAGLRGSSYVMSVSDRGSGTPVAMASSVFERFSHGNHTSARGAGLGLAIVKAISDGHGGSVVVQGRVGGGTRFEMSLPHSSIPEGLPVVPGRPPATEQPH